MSIEYAYDRNGNLTREDNEGMTFTYDRLCHPLAIVGSDNQTDYVYSADGRKFRATPTQYISKTSKAIRTRTQTDYRSRIVANGSVIEQENRYYPYGGIIGDLSLNEEHQDYKFEGKELDRTFGLDWYDIDARQYDAHGDSLTIIGEQKEAALEQLQGEVEGSITLYLDNESGRVSYTKKLNVKKLKGNARKLATVINDKKVNVMVSTRPTNNKRDCTSTNYEMAGGAFMGNELSPDGKSAIAYQEVNPLFLGAADAANGTKGTLMLHEVTEAYYGGLNAIEEQKSAGPAITSKENLEYRNAHNMATPQMPISFYYEDPSGTKRSKDRFFQANRKVYYIGSRPFYQVYLFR